MPGKGRNVRWVGLKLVEERGWVWVFEWGEGREHEILDRRIKGGKIEKMFIRDMEGDDV